MARRRRRLLQSSTSSSLFALIVLLNLMVASTASHHQQHPTSKQQHHKHQHELERQQSRATSHLQGHQISLATSHHQQQQQELSAQESNNLLHHHHHQHQHNSAASSAAHLCAQLPSEVSRQLKLCKLIGQSVEADRAVSSGTSKALAECRSQFQTERWNCTHSHGDHHLLTSELAQSVGNKESGFVHAIAAAGIVHSIATACSVGSLSHCACDKTRVGLIRLQEENWKWGGCSNNIRHGMLFAKHLVELLDAIHQHSRQIAQANLIATDAVDAAVGSFSPTLSGASGDDEPANEAPTLQTRRLLTKRSLSSRHREPNQLRSRPDQLNELGSQQQAALTQADNQQQVLSFCQRNQTNISQAAHMELIKSLLSRNSLEKHQSFRLAMNMHNNKVGRMAVAENMEFRCRCHGLSGSCSLKTCWLTLPNFQVIGAYLKRKYEASVHLPTAVNLNKLIPMMDRNEISAILSSSQQQQQPQSTTPASSKPLLAITAADLAAPAPEFAPLMAPPSVRLLAGSSSLLLAGHNLSAPATNPSHYNYYDRHKQLQALGGSLHQQRLAQLQQPTRKATTTQATSDEIPVNLAPMTQQQYQALLRDMKLCNSSSQSAPTPTPATTFSTGYLTAGHRKQAGLSSKRLQHSNSQQLINGLNGQHLKVANQHLSQVLHSNKDDLIHLHKSPDYCEADLRHGFAGVQSRVCSENPAAPDNCDKLCCGRGYTTHVYQHSYKCDCKFQYCCSIWCSDCEKEVKLVVCN